MDIKNPEKKRKQNKKRKLNRGIVFGIAAVFAVVVAAALIFIFINREKSKPFRADLGNGLMIQEASSFTGTYVEDGSDHSVSNVWELMVTNTGNQDIQFLRIQAQGPGETVTFDITTLTAGSTVKVQAKEAARYPSDEKKWGYTVENLAYFQEPRSLYKDLLTISVSDHTIQLENVSDTDLTKDIYVYYKNTDTREAAKGDDNEHQTVFNGGITYRVKFAGGLASGETAQVQTQHYNEQSSRIMYVTCGE